MLAIPVFRSRVAPVFNWCSKVLLFTENAPDSTSYEEMALTEAIDCFERLRLLQSKGVTTLVCGALSHDLIRYAEDLRIRVICGVAGGISDVLDGYKEHKLNQSLFRLPGCRCERGCGEAQRTMTVEQEKGSTRGQGKGRAKEQGETKRMGGKRAGPGGSCICPICGTAELHARGVPCTHMMCPKCGRQMTRQ
jgi:hypothetical protein